MTQSPPKLTIDLEAELRKIAGKQHLNQVHYAVQLIRHALTHDPANIRVKSGRRRFWIAQDGEPLNRRELELIETLLQDNAWLVRQSAVSELENQHGIALFSRVYTSPRVDIHTENQLLTFENGKLTQKTEALPIKGYRIIVHRKRKRKELREIRFFCKACDVPVFYNGKPINQPFELSNQLLAFKIKTPNGHGVLGIPEQGSLSQTIYMKRGVRFGIHQNLPTRGLVTHGYWNSEIKEFEPNFEISIAEAHNNMKSCRMRLYESLPDLFRSREDQVELKRIILNLELENWRDRFADLPLFNAPNKPFSLTLYQLEGLVAQYGYLPYLTEHGKDDIMLPVLTPFERHFLRKKLRMRVRPALIHRPGRWRLFWLRSFFQRG